MERKKYIIFLYILCIKDAVKVKAKTHLQTFPYIKQQQ